MVALVEAFPIEVAIADEAENWSPLRHVASGEGEFSYPTLLQSNDGLIHLVYTFHRKHIHYARFSEAWLRGETAK